MAKKAKKKESVLGMAPKEQFASDYREHVQEMLMENHGCDLEAANGLMGDFEDIIEDSMRQCFPEDLCAARIMTGVVKEAEPSHYVELED